LMRNYHIYLHGKEQPKLMNNKLHLTEYHLTYCETFYCQQLRWKYIQMQGNQLCKFTKLLRLDFGLNLMTVLCKKLTKWTR
jgi:hypothetical protein